MAAGWFRITLPLLTWPVCCPMIAKVNDVTINRAAAIVVALDKTVAVPRGPNTVCDPMPPNAPARSAALPLCKRTTTIRKKQMIICKVVTKYTMTEVSSIAVGETGVVPEITERTTHRVSLADLRENYTLGGLDEANCDTNPIVQFERWLKVAQVADLKEPNAMTLATATKDGKPSARVVLLKEVSDLGFVFYTNYNSRKGQDLGTNPFAALTFYWAELERQIRVEGRIELLSRAESESYFRLRPRGSQLGAWTSSQSNSALSRTEIERKLKDVEAAVWRL